MLTRVQTDFEDSPALPFANMTVGGISLSVSRSLPSMRRQWEKLEATGLCSFFQSYDWCRAWLETAGKSDHITPVIVLGQRPSGTLSFVLPFQIRKVMGVRVLEWLAQRDCSYGAGLTALDADPQWFTAHFQDLLKLLPGFDVVNLQNCPDTIAGQVNPLKSINLVKAANRSFGLNLEPDYAALHARKRSAKSISKIRRRDARLEEMGARFYECSPDDLPERLAELYNLKDQQLAKLGISPVFDLQRRQFYDLLAQNGKLRLFGLTLKGSTMCLVLGAVHNNVFHLMMTALSETAPLPLSPGDMLLRNVIEWCCTARIPYFDFSPGEADYKLLWAEQETQLFHLIAAFTLAGIPITTYLRAEQSAKRMIKTTPALWTAFQRLRRILRGQN